MGGQPAGLRVVGRSVAETGIHQLACAPPSLQVVSNVRAALDGRWRRAEPRDTGTTSFQRHEFRRAETGQLDLTSLAYKRCEFLRISKTHIV